VAAIFNLVNDCLIAQGKSPTELWNPWLYSLWYKRFMDVANGGCGGIGMTGLPAMKGWTAVTGFGKPWFPSIRNLAANANTTERSMLE
ncbi:hypothetical protein NA56DRAFT_563295, partial [Hyaloscypha hepaticicola]